jgi:hypothetical protein
MSYARVLHSVQSNTDCLTIVYIENKTVRTTHEHHKRAKQVFNQPKRFTIVGTYTHMVPEIVIAEDLAIFGINE